MSNINQAVSAVRELLLTPREQKPSVRLIFGSILREFQNFYNELSNSSTFFTTKEHTLSLTGGTNDYLITGNVGKVLFVTANNNGYPYQVEFTDLADASTDWWYSYPLTAARPEDYNFAAYPLKIAFYRKDGSLYAKVPSQLIGTGDLTIIASTGNWAETVNANSRPVLSEYEHLAHARAAKNLIYEARWTDDAVADERKADRQKGNLDEQEARIYQQFVYAKRSMVADDVVFISDNDGYF